MIGAVAERIGAGEITEDKTAAELDGIVADASRPPRAHASRDAATARDLFLPVGLPPTGTGP